jgi:hypothetical protein
VKKGTGDLDEEKKEYIHGLSHCSDLVDLQEQTVARLLLDGLFDTDWVGDSEIVTDNLNVRARRELVVRLPVVLVEGVFDGDD